MECYCFKKVLTVLLITEALFIILSAERTRESSIIYNRAQLLDFAHSALLHPRERFDIPDEMKMRRRGRRAGLKCKAKLRKYKPAIPSIIMGNGRSLHNKMDKLEGLVHGQRDYREASLLCFTETWLNDIIPIENVTIGGFQTIRADRDSASSGYQREVDSLLEVNRQQYRTMLVTLVT